MGTIKAGVESSEVCDGQRPISAALITHAWLQIQLILY